MHERVWLQCSPYPTDKLQLSSVLLVHSFVVHLGLSDVSEGDSLLTVLRGYILPQNNLGLHSSAIILWSFAFTLFSLSCLHSTWLSITNWHCLFSRSLSLHIICHKSWMTLWCTFVPCHISIFLTTIITVFPSRQRCLSPVIQQSVSPTTKGVCGVLMKLLAHLSLCTDRCGGDGCGAAWGVLGGWPALPFPSWHLLEKWRFFETKHLDCQESRCITVSDLQNQSLPMCHSWLDMTYLVAQGIFHKKVFQQDNII